MNWEGFWGRGQEQYMAAWLTIFPKFGKDYLIRKLSGKIRDVLITSLPQINGALNVTYFLQSYLEFLQPL